MCKTMIEITKKISEDVNLVRLRPAMGHACLVSGVWLLQKADKYVHDLALAYMMITAGCASASDQLFAVMRKGRKTPFNIGELLGCTVEMCKKMSQADKFSFFTKNLQDITKLCNLADSTDSFQTFDDDFLDVRDVGEFEDALRNLRTHATLAVSPASIYNAMECEKLSWDMLLGEDTSLIQVQPRRFAKYLNWELLFRALEIQEVEEEKDKYKEGIVCYKDVGNLTSKSAIDQHVLSFKVRIRNRTCVMYSGMTVSLIVLPDGCMRRDSTTLSNFLFGDQGLRLPVYKLESLSRIRNGKAVTAEEIQVSDGEAGGYSIYVEAVFHRLAFVYADMKD